MINKSISRYKPIYKKFIRLRKNVQNKKKVNLRLFRKKKWRLLNIFLRRQLYRRKKNFRSYDLDSYVLRKYGSNLKRKFLMSLLNKQRISLFYGLLKNKSLKKTVNLSKSVKFKIKNKYSFIEIFERRLDSVLYRTHFTKSFRESRSFIKHGHVSINGKKKLKSNYLLRQGDKITLSFKLYPVIRYNILSCNIWPLPSNNLVINYKTFQILFLTTLDFKSTFNTFPCFLDTHSLSRYYLL